MTSSNTKQFSFVMGTHPEDFRKEETLRSVRRAVMNDYLNRARDDPLSTDKRAKGRRKDISKPPKDKTPQTQPQRSGSATAKPSDRKVDACEGRHVSAHGDPDSPLQAMLGSTTINSIIRPRTNQQKFLDLAEQMKGRPQSSDPSSSYADPALIPGLKMLERHVAFSVAYHRKQSYGHPASVDDFDFYDDLPVSLNLDLLKINCVTYFGSQAAFEQWVPQTSAAPHTFLASLCVSAPYTDLIDFPADRQGISPYTDTRHTAELMDILPRIINDKLSDPIDANCDANIVAVVCLFVGQLSTPYTALVQAHQQVLKSIVILRGGLKYLGGKGVIAMNVSLANLESNMLRHEISDPMFLDWIDEYLARNTSFKSPCPEGPLYRSAEAMSDLARSRLCTARTLHVVTLMHTLTEKIKELDKVQKQRDYGDTSQQYQLVLIAGSISVLIEQTNQMEPIEPAVSTEADWIYEATRLAAIMFCDAVSKRMSGQPARSLWTNGRVTPAMVQNAIKRTPVKPLWDHLAGVLYWILMIASIACHEDPQSDLGKSDVGRAEEQAAQFDASDYHEPQEDYGAVVRARDTYKRIVLESADNSQGTSLDDSCPRTSMATWAQLDDPPPVYVCADKTYGSARDLYSSYVTADQTSVFGYTNAAISTIRESLPASTQTCRPALAQPHQAVDVRPVSDKRARSRPMHGSGRRVRPLRATVSTDQSAEEAHKAKQAYVKRYLTANAMRVSILLRYEHTVPHLTSVRNLLTVTSWLRGT
ncbi:Hypothetical protein D9617_9g023380 [Elsinoe fawcettii]|nr:Hypothetical protein D9617_9g023380 [Elsinoe fawcettii]